jgi:putative transposase
MQVMGLQGVVRGKKVITTNPDMAQPCPDDKVNRAFVADIPNQLWVSDFTYVSSWQGMIYVTFVIDVFARKIVGWRVSTSMTTVRDCARTSGALIAHRAGCLEPGYLPARTVRG